MTPYRNPHLIERTIEDGFIVLINTYSTSGIKILNPVQAKIFNEINGINSIEQIASIVGYKVQELNIFFNSLIAKQIISFDKNFIEPNWNKENPSYLNLWVHTTNKCNLNCTYCYISTLNTTGGMTPETVNQLGKKILQTAIDRKLKAVKLRLAGGEPLLQFSNWREFIILMKKEFKKNNCEFGVSFLTNLTYLDDEIIQFAKKYKIGFGVSLDGYGNYHDLTRVFHNGKGSFDKVSANLEKLMSNGINPSISTVINQQNMEGLPTLTKYLIDLNLHFRYSIVHGEYLNRERLSEILTECYDIIENAIYNKDFEFSKKHRLCDLKPSEIFFQTCSSGYSGGAVYVDGGVYFCHVKFGQNDLSGSIYDNDDLLTTVQKGQHHIGERSNDCMQCNFKYVCTSGCPMYRVDGKDLSCELYHQHLPRFYELLGRERLHKIKKSLSKTTLQAT